MKVKRRHGEASRARLVQAALDLWAAEGPQALTTTRISAEAGLAWSGFYARFASLAGLQAEVVEQPGSRARRLLRRGLAAPQQTAAASTPNSRRCCSRSWPGWTGSAPSSSYSCVTAVPRTRPARFSASGT